MTLTETFTIDTITYKTDAETLTVLRSIIAAAHATGDNSAVAAVMFLGLKTGRIVKA
jgi:hypothetical protein